MSRRVDRRRGTKVVIILVIIITLYYVLHSEEDTCPEQILCYYTRNESLKNLIGADEPTEKSIFFIETSCDSYKNGKITIKARQACAVESAARLNPNLDIYLLYVSPGTLKFEGTESDRFLQALMTYDNVRIRHIDFESYLKDTIVENLNEKLKKSLYPISHASDILRYLTLWRFGGIYMDLDNVVIKSLEDLPLNYVGLESEKYLAAHVLSFKSDGEGHDFAFQCLGHIRKVFNGRCWSRNGPEVITDVARKLCNSNKDLRKLINSTCYANFTVYGWTMFNPIRYWQWKRLFHPNYNRDVEMLIRDSYVVHMSYKMSKNKKIHVKDNVPYANLAKEFCPRVWHECGEYF